jgi:hypothetical protein
MMRSTTRRRFLSLAGGAGLSLPFLSAFTRRAVSQEAGSVGRILIVDMPNVVWRTEWVPRGGRDVNQGTGSASDFQFGPQSSFLEEIREHVTILDGVPIARPGGDPHVAGQIHFMTGDVKTTTAEGAEESHTPSIDQLLAKESPLLSAGRITPAINLSAHTIGESIRPNIHILSFDHALKAIFPQNSPLELYKNLFSAFAPGETFTEQKEQLARRLAENRSVLDYSRATLNRMKARVSSSEQVKLDLHLDGLRELEQKLILGANPSSVDPPDATMFENLKLNETDDHERVIDAFFSLIKSSFAFDLTRVATFMFASGHNWVEMNRYLPGLSETGKVHEITHRSYAGKEQDMNLIADWYGRKVVNFVKDLAATPDLAGGTMLDNTLLVFFSEVTITGEGIAAQHAADNTPLVMIGGKALGHSGGRCLRFGSGTTNDFWATVQQRFGVPRETFGKASDNHGGLAELFTA